MERKEAKRGKEKDWKRSLLWGSMEVSAFVIWTLLIQVVDVQPVGQNGTKVGFATLNVWFHEVTGVRMALYTITDWLGLVPIAVCMGFGVLGFFQWVKRKRLLKVDCDILLLGIYYVIVIVCYLVFEMIPINYRPVPIDGRMEASYPSSTTLLVLGVMPTLVYQTRRRVRKSLVIRVVCSLTGIFSVYMVLGRLLSGVHWFTDIVGSVILSTGLFCIYKAVVLRV
ncbi:MAG: phosphatase PAP2 family protein [Lachnospiraceae bacterium]|nr:phosphatase PAP2 family protein [Lachnospiraceae bacterium]